MGKQIIVIGAGRLLHHKDGANTALPAAAVYRCVSRYAYGVSWGVHRDAPIYHSDRNTERIDCVKTVILYRAENAIGDIDGSVTSFFG